MRLKDSQHFQLGARAREPDTKTMSWSRCTGRAVVHLQTGPRHAVLSVTLRHRLSALSHAFPSSASCSLQHHVSDRESSARPRPSSLESTRRHRHVSGLGSHWSPILRQYLATTSPVHDIRGLAHGRSHGRGYSTQAKVRTVKGPTHMELFAGMGCFTVALSDLGYTCIYANENNPFCVQTFEKKKTSAEEARASQKSTVTALRRSHGPWAIARACCL